MPINIYRIIGEGEENEQLDWLCDGEWHLSPQIDALSDWLRESTTALPAGEYVADVGFCWRRDAACGGPVLAPASMQRMSELGMYLFLSEYSGFADEDR